MLNPKDIQQLADKGISTQLFEKQIDNFKNAFPYMKLYAAATPNNGLFKLDAKAMKESILLFENKMLESNILKFVPASGAASRMFKHLFEAYELLKSESSIANILEDKGFNSVWNFFDNLKNFAFYPALKEVMSKAQLDLDELLHQEEYLPILEYLLTEKGLNYGKLPKALLLFHKYPKEIRLALEEHLVEGVYYAKNKEDRVRIHFTVSEDHMELFKAALSEILPKYENRFSAKFQIEFSTQKQSTDTLAVDMQNKPFRLDNGDLLFRPGGHGALIENLNDLDAEIVFLKNIDNIVPDALREETYTYKKLIGGILIQQRDKIFNYLDLLDRAEVDDDLLNEMYDYLRNEIYYQDQMDFDKLNRIEKVDYLYQKLNRPIRVCGMVKNEGEPGGGPFIVEQNGVRSLQIVESSQIDLSDPEQKEIVQKATHFNPVDLVCLLTDFKGNAFHLPDFVDPNTGFISKKSLNGRDLKAQELPGLWNGAMADWCTFFVEVPIITFNPVKTINDLLRPNHQA